MEGNINLRLLADHGALSYAKFKIKESDVVEPFQLGLDLNSEHLEIGQHYKPEQDREVYLLSERQFSSFDSETIDKLPIFKIKDVKVTWDEAYLHPSQGDLYLGLGLESLYCVNKEDISRIFNKNR